MSETGVGARVPRKEDDRFLRGRGQYVADIKLAGMKDVAFLRSPLAHARIRAVQVPEKWRGAVFTAEDLTGVRPIRAVSALPGFKPSEQPPLATGKVRHVGELVAICVARTRAEAEDIAAEVEVDFEELPAVVDMLEARAPGAPLVHEDWGDNVFLETLVDGDVDSVKDRAAIKVSREIRTARQCMMPIEGRGVVAAWDSRREQLVVHSAAQMPHVTRTGLTECLGLDHGQVRVIAPDVGGGFGYKGILLPEEVCLSWLTMHLGHPVRWIEDRREHLSATANCREHHYLITAYAEADGRLLAIDAEATVDSGAYSIYPFTAGLEAAQIGSILPGPYDFPVYRCRTWSVASNKPPIMPYRGVARTGVCFAMELMLDAVAREAGLEPHEVRLKNLVPPEAMPFDNITGKHFDSGDYPECLRRAVAAIDLAAVRERQARGAPDGRLVGVGFAVYCEQAAHGTSVYAAWGIPMVPGHEQASARITPDGGLELRVGVHSHGQGLETTLAQVAHEVLGIDIDKVKLVLGDTEYTPYSTGTWGSRCMVMAGGAVVAACRELAERLAKIGAHLLQVPVAAVTVQDGKGQGASGSVGIAERQTAAYPALSPGGWNLIGRTPAPLFDRQQDFFYDVPRGRLKLRRFEDGLFVLLRDDDDAVAVAEEQVARQHADLPQRHGGVVLVGAHAVLAGAHVGAAGEDGVAELERAVGVAADAVDDGAAELVAAGHDREYVAPHRGVHAPAVVDDDDAALGDVVDVVADALALVPGGHGLVADREGPPAELEAAVDGLDAEEIRRAQVADRSVLFLRRTDQYRRAAKRH